MNKRPNAKPRAAQLAFVPPLLTVLVDAPPAGDGWLH
jgi:hypothetical protein